METYLTSRPPACVLINVYRSFVLEKKIGSWDSDFSVFVPELTCQIRIMNFDRTYRAKASAVTMFVVGESATVGRAHIPRAEGKIGRVPQAFGGRTLDRSIHSSAESRPCQTLRVRGGFRNFRPHVLPMLSRSCRLIPCQGQSNRCAWVAWRKNTRKYVIMTNLH